MAFIVKLLSKVEMNNCVIIFCDHACSDWSCDKIYKKIGKQIFLQKKLYSKKHHDILIQYHFLLKK